MIEKKWLNMPSKFPIETKLIMKLTFKCIDFLVAFLVNLLNIESSHSGGFLNWRSSESRSPEHFSSFSSILIDFNFNF